MLRLNEGDINLYYEGCHVVYQDKHYYVRHGDARNNLILQGTSDEDTQARVELNDPDLLIDYPETGLINDTSSHQAVELTRRDAKQYRRGINRNNSRFRTLSRTNRDRMHHGRCIDSALKNTYYPLPEALGMLTREGREHWMSVAVTPKVAVGCEVFSTVPVVYYTHFLVGYVQVEEDCHVVVISKTAEHLFEELSLVFDDVRFLEV
jgi:hypothetical protein